MVPTWAAGLFLVLSGRVYSGGGGSIFDLDFSKQGQISVFNLGRRGAKKINQLSFPSAHHYGADLDYWSVSGAHLEHYEVNTKK